ncbi:hypothetical protein Tco_0211669 [Tanacetum coccineum]
MHYGSGHFMTSEDGTLTYNGGEANATNVTSETPFSDLKLSLAKICDLKQETHKCVSGTPGFVHIVLEPVPEPQANRFIAIPQVVAITYLALCYNNIEAARSKGFPSVSGAMIKKIKNK